MEKPDSLLFRIPEQLIDDDMRKWLAPFRPEDVLFLRLMSPQQEKEERANIEEETDAFVAELVKSVFGEKD